jgi:hypothetical protein
VVHFEESRFSFPFVKIISNFWVETVLCQLQPRTKSPSPAGTQNSQLDTQLFDTSDGGDSAMEAVDGDAGDNDDEDVDGDLGEIVQTECLDVCEDNLLDCGAIDDDDDPSVEQSIDLNSTEDRLQVFIDLTEKDRQISSPSSLISYIEEHQSKIGAANNMQPAPSNLLFHNISTNLNGATVSLAPYK